MEPTAPPVTVNVTEVIDRGKIGLFHIRVIVLCAVALFADGFDNQVMGYVGPAVQRAWKLSPGSLGPVFSAALIGLMLGALLWGPIADRVGRKTAIIVSLLIFALGSLATPLASSLTGLFWLRLVTGLGLGGAMPNAIALTAEYAPQRLRTTLIMLMWFGFSTGAGSGGAIAAILTDTYGWHAAFYFGGILPLAIVPLLLLFLPESLRLLVAWGAQGDRIAGILRRVDRSFVYRPGTMRFALAEPKTREFPVKMLFRDGRAATTLLLWVMFFMNLLDLYFLGNWMPILMHQSGIPQNTAILATSLLHFGGIAGSIVVCALCDRIGSYGVLAVTYIGVGVFTAAIGSSGASVPFVLATGAGAGFCITGAQMGANAFAASFYPTEARATGVGWALGIGRIGSILGPLIAGILVAIQWSTPSIFAIAGVAGFIAAGAVLILGRLSRARGTADLVAVAGRPTSAAE